MATSLHLVSIYPKSGRYEVQEKAETDERLHFPLNEPNPLFAEVKSITFLIFDYDMVTDNQGELEKPNLRLLKIFPRLETVTDLMVYVLPSDFIDLLDFHSPKVTNYTHLWFYEKIPGILDETEEKLLLKRQKQGCKALKSLDFIDYSPDHLWDELKMCGLRRMHLTLNGEEDLGKFLDRIIDKGIPSKSQDVKFCLNFKTRKEGFLHSVTHSTFHKWGNYSINGGSRLRMEKFTFKHRIDQDRLIVVVIYNIERYNAMEIFYEYKHVLFW